MSDCMHESTCLAHDGRSIFCRGCEMRWGPPIFDRPDKIMREIVAAGIVGRCAADGCARIATTCDGDEAACDTHVGELESPVELGIAPIVRALEVALRQTS